MASRIRKRFRVCRFCLSRTDLKPLTTSKDFTFTTQEILHYTGIQIAEEEKPLLLICDRCCSLLEKSVAFRKFCLANDIRFKQLLSTQNDGFRETIEISDDSDRCDDTEPDEIENEETGRLLSTSNEDEGMRNTDEERKTESMDEQEEETNATESETNEVQVKPKKQFKRKLQLCGICGKLVNNLTGHNKNHNKEKKYSCPHCQIKMSNHTNMKRHIESVHEKKIIVCCEQCGKGFTNRNSYALHMMSHHGIGKTYECTVCSKTFNTSQKYSAHKLKWHTIQDEVSCAICQMMFRSKRQLAIHQRVHSSDQPYACNQCPKRFKSPHARKIHQLTHSGIRFSCTLCEKSYSYKSLLNVHIRRDHTEDTICDVTDTQNVAN